MVKGLSMVVESPKTMVAREFPLPDIGTNDLLLKVERVGICGSDPKMYLGEHELKNYPKILGHEVVGHVEAAGENAAQAYSVKKGDRVVVEPYIPCHRCEFCLKGFYQLCKSRRSYGVHMSCTEPPYLWGAYGQYMYVAPGSRIHHVPDSVPAEAACLASVIGNGVRWIRTKGRVQFGESVVIIGSGAQGLASVIAAHEAGAEPIIVMGLSKDQRRFALAYEFGADYAVNVEKEDPIAAVRSFTHGEMADVVVDCAGAARAITMGLDLLRPLGRYVLAGKSNYAPIPMIVDKIVTNELTLYGGYGQPLDVEAACRVISSGKYPIEKMVTHTFSLMDGERAMRFFIEHPDECIRVALDPWG